jgi:hypothetical protein
MTLYNQLVYKLLKREPLNPKEVYITIYYPYDRSRKFDFKLELKSFLYEKLRKSTLKQYTKFHEIVVKKVHEAVDKIKDVDEGVAIFMCLDPEAIDKGHIAEIPDENFDLITIPVKPEKEAFVGRIYDLDQLMSYYEATVNTLIVNLEEKQAKFYFMKQNHIYPIEKADDELTVKKGLSLWHYFLNPKRNAAKGEFYGHGRKNLSNKEDEYHKKFIQEMLDFTMQNRHKLGYNYLVTFYSPKFAKSIDLIKETLDKLQGFISINLREDIQDENQLLELANEAIAKVQDKARQDLLAKAKDEPQKFVSGWGDVTNSAHSRRIKTLFINLNASCEGYLLANEVYTEPMPKGEKIRNIAPWIIKDVLRSGGEVIFLKAKGDFVAGKLWY